MKSEKGDVNAEYIEYQIQANLKGADIRGETTIEDRIVRLQLIQESIYRALLRRSMVFGVPIPEQWRKWKRASEASICTTPATKRY